MVLPTYQNYKSGKTDDNPNGSSDNIFLQFFKNSKF